MSLFLIFWQGYSVLGGVQWTLLAAQMRSFRHVTQTVSWPTAMTLNPADAQVRVRSQFFCAFGGRSCQ